MIVTARARRDMVNATATGWNAEAFARTESMKPLGHYLAEPKPEDQRRDEGAARVLAMMKRLAGKGAHQD